MTQNDVCLKVRSVTNLYRRNLALSPKPVEGNALRKAIKALCGASGVLLSSDGDAELCREVCDDFESFRKECIQTLREHPDFVGRGALLRALRETKACCDEYVNHPRLKSQACSNVNLG